MVGYTRPASFATFFRKQTGLSPRQFRENGSNTD
jgi:AraC-like DNA-binding protein